MFVFDDIILQGDYNDFVVSWKFGRKKITVPGFFFIIFNKIMSHGLVMTYNLMFQFCEFN